MLWWQFGCADPAKEAQEVRYAGLGVALQDQSAMGLLDAYGNLSETLDLTTEADGQAISWMIHNVQITPDARTALATAMPNMDQSGALNLPDQLIVVPLDDPDGYRRCDLDYGLGIAHVVTDGHLAYATAYNQDRIVVVDPDTCETVDRWPLPSGSHPHGLRFSSDQQSLWVAGAGDGSLHRVSLATANVDSYDVPGIAVQVAVVPDGSAVFVTLNDAIAVSRLDVESDALTTVPLPSGAMGPAQIYPAPDSGSVWVADQGPLDGTILGHEVYQLDAATGEARAEVMVNEAPHGLVVSADGRDVWVTTLGAGTVDRVDVEDLTLASSTPVGPGPNGISLALDGEVMP